jgi:5,6,7,8-tetrahydromethanopterin hydro-lyase
VSAADPPEFARMIQVGEAFAGDAPEAAHVNTVLGRKGGPFETAWVTALAAPGPGHLPFLAVVRPDLPVLPRTVFVNKATLDGERHSTLTWGAAQAGVAAGVADAVVAGTIPEQEVENLRLLVTLWVDPRASQEQAVLVNNRAATAQALERGASGFPPLDDVLAARDAPANAFLRHTDEREGPGGDA